MRLPRIFIFELGGGLGNQMFQYAFYSYMKINYHGLYLIDNTCFYYKPLHNGYELESIFGLKLPIVPLLMSKIIRKLPLIVDYFTEKAEGSFQEINLPTNKKILFCRGYWQTDLYFKTYRDVILNDFRFPIENLSDRAIAYKNIIATSEVSVSIHIRGGDYLDPINAPILGDICTGEYYQQALSIVKSQNTSKHLKLFVFTNDRDFASSLFVNEDIISVDGNIGSSSWADMYLMSICKVNIIANSTFSWWAAWLNTNDGKMVIAPKRWLNVHEMKDIIPSEWIKL